MPSLVSELRSKPQDSAPKTGMKRSIEAAPVPSKVRRTEENPSYSKEEIEVARQLGEASGISDMTVLIQGVKLVKRLGEAGLQNASQVEAVFKAYTAGILTKEEVSKKLPSVFTDLLKTGDLGFELLQALVSLLVADQVEPSVGPPSASVGPASASVGTASASVGPVSASVGPASASVGPVSVSPPSLFSVKTKPPAEKLAGPGKPTKSVQPVKSQQRRPTSGKNARRGNTITQYKGNRVGTNQPRSNKGHYQQRRQQGPMDRGRKPTDLPVVTMEGVTEYDIRSAVEVLKKAAMGSGLD